MMNQREPEPISIPGVKKTNEETTGFWGRMFQSERLVCLIACLFLGTGFSLAMFSLMELETTFFRIFGLALVGTAMIAVTTFRWWILASAFTVTVVSNIAYHYYHDSLDQLYEYWTGFVSWIIGGAVFHEVFSEGLPLALLHFIMILPILSIIYPIAKRPVLYPGLIALNIGFLIFSYVMVPGDMSLALCASLAGIIVLLPGLYARAIEKSGEVDKKTRARMQMIAVPAAIITVLFANWIVPADTSDWRSRSLINLTNDIIYLFRGPTSSWPRVTPNFSMHELGFQAERNRLGGPADLKNNIILNVESPVPVLLKGRVFDVYTGSNWVVGRPDGDFRFESVIWRRFRREALGQDRPMGGRRTERHYREATSEIDVRVIHANGSYQSLFTTGRIRTIDFSTQLLNPIAFFNMRSEVYMHARMPARHGILINTRVWDTSRADFNSMFLELEAIAANEDDRRFDALFERYTQLPDNLPDSVRVITEQVTAGDETPYSKVLSIVEWLNENFEYSLEPEIVPEGEDFVDYFFRTGVGYCTYFASALAVMARCAGIPSRYVIGFALEVNSDVGTSFVATGETAHAWVELYFRGIGWVEIDPLKWNPNFPLNSREVIELPVEPPLIEMPEPEFPPEIPESEVVVGTVDVVEITQTTSYFWYIGIPLGLIALFVLPRVTIRVLLKRKSRQFAIKKVCVRKNDSFRQLEIYYIDILKQLKLLGVQSDPGETLLTFSARVDDRIKPEGVRFSLIAEYVSAYYFAGNEPSRDHIEDAYKYHKQMEKTLFEWLGKWPYIIKRAIR